MNKVALIIGAGDSIGGAIAKKFAKQGMTVCVTRRTESKIIELAKEINQSGGKAFGFACACGISVQVAHACCADAPGICGGAGGGSGTPGGKEGAGGRPLYTCKGNQLT